jgi:hypothetical protein
MLSSPGPSPSVSFPPAAPASPGAPTAGLVSWQAVHARLVSQPVAATQAPDFANLTVYLYCVGRAGLAAPGTARLVPERFEQLMAQLEHQLRLGAWPLAQLDQACAAAWLNARLTSEGLAESPPALLRLDEALHAEALRLQGQPDGVGRQAYFRVLRYFSLRLPAPAARACLQALLALPLPPPTTEPLPLGLADGQAAELLLLLNLHKAGIQPGIMLAHVRAGITRLLELRRPVDFQETQYSVFPYEVRPASGQASFSAELSWRRGDIGQSLLLHEAHERLQDDELFKIAELVGLNTLLRTTAHTTELATSQLALGSAGVAYLYARLHQVGGHAAYQAGHTFWLTQTWEFLRQELASGFYQQRTGDLAHGLVGVGLVLLASLTDAELGWDTLVL